MKTLLCAAALCLSSAALAQTADEAADQDRATTAEGATQPSGETVDDLSQSTGPRGITQQGTDPNGTATTPAGANQGMVNPATTRILTVWSPSQNTALAPRPAAGDYPVCSRSVTDSCVQAYERGVRRPSR